MRRATWLTAAGIVILWGSGHAQTVNIWSGVAPGSETWTRQERTVESTSIGTVVFNVVTPTLTAYLPERSKATGTGVIVAPGGAFVALAIEVEGTRVARWLQERGIAAFVLKYRIVEKREGGIPAMDMDTAGRYGIADGIRALAVVRQRAAEWGVSPGRVYAMLRRWLCSGECNIRVDLLLAYPALVLLSVAAAVAMLRSGDRHRQET